MATPASYLLHKTFERTGDLFAKLPGSAVAFLTAASADIALIVEPDGTIIDVAFDDDTLDNWELNDWIGQKLSNVVTSECVDKIEAMLEDAKTAPMTRKRQVNHAAPGQMDLPVAYRIAAIEGARQKLVIGEDFRKMAEIQQRLVQTQFELESEYRKIREAEGRYRTIFQKSSQPVIAVDGETGAVIDANLAATAMLGMKRAKLNGDNITACFARSDRIGLMDAISSARHSGALKTVKTTLTENERSVDLSLEPYRENGRTNILVTIHASDAGTKSSNAAHDGQMVLDSFPEALVTTDLKGNILEANDQFLDLVHVLNKNALVSRNLNSWLGASTVDMQVLLTRLRDERQVRQFSSVVRDELGDSTPVTVSASRYGDGPEARIGLFISDAVRRETSLSVPKPGGDAGSSDFAELVGRVPLKDLIREASDVIEKMCIEAALRQTENNRASAADMLGLSRQSLYIKLRRHGLENYDGRS